MKRFPDRAAAGAELAAMLDAPRGDPKTIVLGLARGGVVVAAAVAEALDVPLDVVVVRKLGAPGREELAIGAIASGGIRVVNEDVLRVLGLGEETIAAVARREQHELARREALYRGGRPAAALQGRHVILVDDGLATGASMRAAVRAVQAQRPERVTVAVPVASREARDDIARLVDEVVCAELPEPFWGVGAWYEDFSQTTDREVTRLLTPSPDARPGTEDDQ